LLILETKALLRW